MIATFATVVWVSSILLVSEQADLAAEVNVAGRQRMLSQKIALLTSELGAVRVESRQALREEILACVDLMERAHHIMISRDGDLLRETAAEGTNCHPGTAGTHAPGAMSETLSAAYFQGAPSLDTLLNEYLRSTRGLVEESRDWPASHQPDQRRLFAIAHRELPTQLDHVAQIIQREGEARAAWLVTFKTAMWIATLLLLVFEVLLIFRPMVRRVSDTIRAIKNIALDLAERHSSEHDLKVSNHAKSRFLAHMSHELRTPLNAVNGYAQVLLEADELGVPEDRRREYACNILASGKHLLDRVDELLDLARIDAGTMTVACDAVDIGRLAGGVASMLRLKASQRNQNIQVHHRPYSVHVYADQKLLRRALINLVDNALKYGRDGGTVSIRYIQRSQDQVEVVVEDDGIGIDPQDLPFLLEPFARAETNPDVTLDGVGLGLPLTKRFVDAQGGTLSISSTPGAGTAATIILASIESQFAQSG